MRHQFVWDNEKVVVKFRKDGVRDISSGLDVSYTFDDILCIEAQKMIDDLSHTLRPIISIEQENFFVRQIRNSSLHKEGEEDCFSLFQVMDGFRFKYICYPCLQRQKEIDERQEQWGKRDDYVYFIHAKHLNYIKIGHSVDPNMRLKDRQREIPDILSLVGTAKGNQYIESTLHKYFREYKVKDVPQREWFQNNQKLQELIRLVNDNAEILFPGNGHNDLTELLDSLLI